MMRSQAWIALAGALGLVILGYTVLMPANFPRLAQLKFKEDSLLAEIADNQRHIEQLEQEAEDLSGDSARSLAHLEKIAREEFSLIGRDETLLLLDTHTD